jgi:hypothetical protein
MDASRESLNLKLRLRKFSKAYTMVILVSTIIHSRKSIYLRVQNMIPCRKLSNATPRRSDVEQISKQYSMTVLMQGIASVLFGTSRKRHARRIVEKQIVGSFSTQHATMDLLELLHTTKANPLAGVA